MDTGTLADRVYQVLRERILQGAYQPGQKLNLAQLARDLAVSNTPVREAMARLERIGLVEAVPYCGPKVKRLSPAQVADVFDVRIALEELAVRLVAQRQAPDALQACHRLAHGRVAHLQVARQLGQVEFLPGLVRALQDPLAQGLVDAICQCACVHISHRLVRAGSPVRTTEGRPIVHRARCTIRSVAW